MIVEDRYSVFAREIGTHFKSETRQGSITKPAIAPLFAADYIFVQRAVMKRDAQARANEKISRQISNDVVNPAIR